MSAGTARFALPPGMSVEAMNAEAVLDDAIDPWSAAPARAGDAEAVLLTGATGFLGAFLLAELTERTAATIYCLVRASSESHGRERLRANLRRFLLPERGAERAEIILGDLAQPLLGLDADTFDRLAAELDAIQHCGATVKWTYPYSLLKAANVLGTHEVLRMASRRRLKPVHFISTVGVFSSPEFTPGTVLETERLDHSGPLAIGYAQTKWVAEKLVTLAGCRGLPTSIYRPNIAWHSATGAFNAADHLCLMIQGCLEMGAAPELDWEVAGAAVDYVARAVTHLGQQPESTGRAFHLVAPHPLDWNDLVTCLMERHPGLRRMAIADWREALRDSVARKRGSTLAALSPLFSDALIQRVRLPRFDSRVTAQHLAGTGISCPELDRGMVQRLLDRMEAR